MTAKTKKRAVLVVCSLFLVTLLAGMAIAQTIQEEKKVLAQTSTQSQFSYQKMIQSKECTQQMAQNQYTYKKKVQNKTSNRKMTKSGGGNSTPQGQQDSRSSNNGSTHGGGKN